jgi:hypothetical protein
MSAGETDDVVPDMPGDDGVAEPELGTLEVEGARLLGNEAGPGSAGTVSTTTRSMRGPTPTTPRPTGAATRGTSRG